MEKFASKLSAIISLLGMYYTGMNVRYDITGRKPTKLLEAIMWAVIIGVVRHYFTTFIFDDIGRKWIASTAAKRNKVAKFSSCAFKTLFFIIIVYLEWAVLISQEYTPRMLFGNGETSKLWTSDFVPSEELVSVFMASLGYHIHSTIYHVFLVERRSDFHQMVLHHIVTLWLMILSFLEGHIRIGTLIVFTNDIADIFVYSTRMLGDTVFVKSSIISYILLTISYFYFRIVVFPACILPSILAEATGLSQLELYTYAAFLGALYILHGYWFGLIVRIGFNLATTGSRKDILADNHASND
jgi:hypothetical protein